MTDLAISIVVSTNNHFLLPCLKSLFEAEQEADFEVWVVDNLAREGDIDSAKADFPQIRVIRNKQKLGFSANHNQVLRAADAKYYLLLNDDTVAAPGALKRLLDFMEANPDTGCACPRLLNGDGSVQEAAFRLPSLGLLLGDAFMLGSIFPNFVPFAGYKRWAHDKNRDVPFVSGAAILFSKTLMEKIGLWDEAFFIFSEDADYCRRSLDAGYKNRIVADAVVTHFGGQTVGRVTDACTHYVESSILRYMAKHHGPWAGRTAWLLQIFSSLTHILAFLPLAAFSGRRRDRLAYFRKRLLWHLKNARWGVDPKQIPHGTLFQS